MGSLVKVQPTEPELPAAADAASAPKVTTEVSDEVLEVCDPAQAVPGEVTEQVYWSRSPAVGGEATDGPPEGEKSLVTRVVMVPLPPICVVRTL